MCKSSLLFVFDIISFNSYRLQHILPLTHTHSRHSHTLSGTSSQERALDWLLVPPAWFPAGRGYWQSHLARPHQWPKPGPPSSLHWFPIKKTRDSRWRERGKKREQMQRIEKSKHKEGVVQGERRTERSFKLKARTEHREAARQLDRNGH